MKYTKNLGFFQFLCYRDCIVKNKEKISELLTRAVDEVIERDRLEKDLQFGRKLRVKFGIDPTTPDLHLGHTVPLRKLKCFQELGHKAVLIIGDFTATVGDPSGRAESRRPLDEKTIRKNMKHYLKQIGSIVDLSRAEIRYNSEWYKRANMMLVYNLMSMVTVQRALERDDFQKRLREKRDVSVLEVVYPLLQAYDSVVVNADVELGGRDQKFNLLMGRRIQRHFGKKEQNIITTWLIEGTDGVRKMSKSFGNYIGIKESPDSVFGKIMSIPDDLIIKYFVALTDVPMGEIENMKQSMRINELNPRDAKFLLGEKIISIYDGDKAATKAKNKFVKIFSERKLTDIPEVRFSQGSYPPIQLLLQLKLVNSKSEARRLLEQKAVEIDGKVVTDPNLSMEIYKGTVIRVGKRRFVKIK